MLKRRISQVALLTTEAVKIFLHLHCSRAIMKNGKERLRKMPERDLK